FTRSPTAWTICANGPASIIAVRRSYATVNDLAFRNFGLRILDFGFHLSYPYSKNFGFRISDCGFRISDFGLRISNWPDLRNLIQALFKIRNPQSEIRNSPTASHPSNCLLLQRLLSA